MSSGIDESGALLLKEEVLRQSGRTSGWQRHRFFHDRYFYFNCFFTLFNLYFLAVLLKGASDSTSGSECESPLIYSPAIGAVQPERKYLHIELDTENEYNGKPNPSNDAAWMKLFKNANIRVRPEEIKLTNRTSIQLSDGSGDFYGTLDIYHQLHCVKYIREYVHPEYYNLKETQVSHIDHIDHCIDMLRQLIMCKGDIALTTYKWLPDWRLPWPDFGLAHECRSWESIDNWSSERAIDVSDYSLIVHPKLGPSFVEPEWNRTKNGD